MKQSLLIFTFVAYTFIACNYSSPQNKTEAKAVPTNTTTTAEDSIVYDHSIFPMDGSLTTKILTTGIFHSDEVWDNADKQQWFGLFKKKFGYYIVETKLNAKRVHDDIVDEQENEKTAWNVQTSIKDSPIILVQGTGYLSLGNVQQAVLSKQQILPGDSLRFTYLGIDYILYATGGKKKMQDVNMYEVWNYKLYLTATIKAQQLKSLLVAQPSFNDNMITLLFAGDMDGDGILDLIIDTSAQYNATNPTIYLSKHTNKGEVVKPIGAHHSVGC